MKILTVKQPWAWLIVNGHKSIENRTWATSYRGPILIQASARKDADFDYAVQFARERGIEIPADIAYGGIVGAAVVIGCITSSKNPWFFGPIGWQLEAMQRLPFTPIKGQLGLFDAPDCLVTALKPHFNPSLSKFQLDFGL